MGSLRQSVILVETRLREDSSQIKVSTLCPPIASVEQIRRYGPSAVDPPASVAGGNFELPTDDDRGLFEES
jgi:hypothetical protein